MTDQEMSPLRRRMIENMTIRKFAPKTQHDYLQRVKNFAAFLGRSPDTASFEDVRRYQLHLTTSGAGEAAGKQHPLHHAQERHAGLNLIGFLLQHLLLIGLQPARAPSRRTTEPTRLKSTWDSTHRRMKGGAHVNRSEVAFWP
jgi:Phage integrase, N-terminal SAM-like domain